MRWLLTCRVRSFARAVECFRKVLLVGAFILLGQGTTLQMVVGMIVCCLCVMIYNNIKPYESWQVRA